MRLPLRLRSSPVIVSAFSAWPCVEAAICRRSLHFVMSIAAVSAGLTLQRLAGRWRFRAERNEAWLSQACESSAADCPNSSIAVSASSVPTCNRIPRVRGHSTLAMLASARKHSIPAERRQPCASNASDMFPNWRIVTSSAASWSFADCIESSLRRNNHTSRAKVPVA